MVWWTATLFIVGSALFALGVVLAWFALAGPSGAVFFAGSVFFTCAATLQYRTATRPGSPRRRRWLPRPRHVDRLSAASQLLGTLLFNVDTWRAWVLSDLTVAQADRLVWAPDAIGSALFLVSSALALLPEIRERRHHHVPLRSRWIAGLNLCGSALFGVSALGAFLLPRAGRPLSDSLSNAGTFLGALCFLAAAALLLPGRAPKAPGREATGG